MMKNNFLRSEATYLNIDHTKTKLNQNKNPKTKNL